MVEDGETKNRLIKSASKKMLNLVLNMLDVSRSETTRMELDKKTWKLSDIVVEATGEVRYLCTQAGTRIIRELNKDYILEADFEVLVRVFVNLLTNAIKFSPKNSDIILKATEEQNGAIRISVIDSGPGIAPEFHEKIFEKFAQIRQVSSGNSRSSGLGLTFCRQAVEAHGWSIGVRSEPGNGAEFYILAAKTVEEKSGR